MRRVCLLLGMLLCADTASTAELSGHLAVATEWFDRGISQTAGRPALQASVELAAESGIYLGLWGSNVAFGDCCRERVQLDWIIGVTRPWGPVDWDAGLTWSSFPGASSELDLLEYHLGLGWSNFDLAVYWTPNFARLGRELWYLEAGAAFELPWQALRLVLHAGYTRGRAIGPRFTSETGLEPYRDWQITLERDIGPVVAALGWADTDLGAEFRVRDRVERNDGRLFFSLRAGFP